MVKKDTGSFTDAIVNGAALGIALGIITLIVLAICKHYGYELHVNFTKIK